MKKTLVIAALLAAVALPGCARQSPCATLAAPTTGQVAAAAEGAEVEVEVGSTECVVDARTKTWVEDRD